MLNGSDTVSLNRLQKKTAWTNRLKSTLAMVPDLAMGFDQNGRSTKRILPQTRFASLFVFPSSRAPPLFSLSLSTIQSFLFFIYHVIKTACSSLLKRWHPPFPTFPYSQCCSSTACSNITGSRPGSRRSTTPHRSLSDSVSV
jgi:hypothetical protein